MIVYVVFSMQEGAKQLEGIFAKKDDAKGLVRYLEKVDSLLDGTIGNYFSIDELIESIEAETGIKIDYQFGKEDLCEK